MLNDSINAATMAALADPVRLGIVTHLMQGEKTVSELAAPFDISQPAISRHIRVLSDAGLITQRVDGARRPCRLNPAPFGALEDWLSMLRRRLDANYSKLDTILAQMKDPPDDA